MAIDATRTDLSLGKLSGASPAEDRFYVVVFFDISESKKYRRLIKILKKYSSRIQKSVFEAHLKKHQIRELKASIDNLMTSEKYHELSDNVRIYRISGNCEVTVFGSYQSTLLEENIFI